jgi:NitT/TauT family transport system permease protein
MVLPIVWGNTKSGIISTDKSLLEMGQVYKFSRIKTFSMIYIPSVMPYFMAAFTSGLGLGWKAGVAAEIICLPRHSIGIQLNNAKIYLETVDLFAWTAAVIIISVILRKLLVYLALKASKKYGRQVSLK